MPQQIQLRRDTTANWTTSDPVLAEGEVGVDLDTNEVRVGDGVSLWSALSPVGGAGGLQPTLLAGGGTESYQFHETAEGFGEISANAGGTARMGVTNAFAGKNSLTFGSVAASSGGDNRIGADAYASFAFGYVHGSGTGLVVSNGRASMAHGYVFGNGEIKTQGNGGSSHGYTKDGGVVDAREGASAFGVSFGNNDAGVSQIYASARSLAFGYTAKTATADALANTKILGGDDGALAHGFVKSSGTGDNYVRARGKGSLAGGYIYAGGTQSGSRIYANGSGNIAHGKAFAGGATPAIIRAFGDGSLALGYAYAHNIYAQNDGAVALGRAMYGDILATGVSSMQLGEGTNSQPVSLSVGGGVRINDATAPTTPRNGDIWVDGTGNVIVRSNGINVTIA